MSTNTLKAVVLTLYEQDGKPWIRIVIEDHSGEAAMIETELDARVIRVNFDDECEENDDESVAWVKDHPPAKLVN